MLTEVDETAPPEAAGISAAALEALTGAKRVLIGPPRPSRAIEETLLPKTLALPIFASDPISSVAYATEAALAVLVAVSVTSRHLVFPISIAIAALLAIVVLSYRQGIRAYSSSGGSYVFAKENLGTFAGLLAAAALLTDYILTVAVSVAAGVFAITSAAPSLSGYRIELSLACIVVLTLGNLRGVRESGFLFAFPTYAFVASIYAVLAVGFWKGVTSAWPHATVPHPLPVGAGTITVFVLLKAFASGSAALTGVESISNGVTAFRRPQARNAARTLLFMAGIAITLFLGVSFLAVKMDARPSSTTSVLSQVARGVFPAGSSGSVVYYLVQAFTLAILILAANTSYQGFPRLAALLARDGFFPRQFLNLGDRLVFSNGMIILAGLSAALILAFRAKVDSLIHLYVIGVFTAFTLAQAGMVRYWLRTRESRWRRSAVMNGIGSATTLVVTVIVIWTKFTAGAYMVIIAIPATIACFYGVNRHYRRVSRRLRAKAKAVLARPQPANIVVLYVERLDTATREAFWYARRISGGSLRAIHVPFPGSDPGIRPRFFAWSEGRPALEVLPEEEEPLDAVLEYVWTFPHGEGDFVTVVIPELFRKPSLVDAVRRHSTFSLKRGLIREPGLVVTDVPKLASSSNGEWVQPKRAVGLVPISDVNAVSLRALIYARSLGLDETRAVYFSFEDGDAAKFERAWEQFPTGLPLDVVDAPFRDLGKPLLAQLRMITADPEAVAVVVMPELVVRGTDRLLHNQRALYLKRLLLFEPRVTLTSVPYQLV
ncbi:MAG: APC family permease [Actinobacteria bacterium]|nr:MAG: APC family permease [Actinomycetota bacterium]